MSALIPSLVEQLENAVRLESQGDLERARVRYRAVLEEAPEAPEALSLLGQLECRLGDHNAAVFHLRRASRLAPGRPDIHLGLGNALADAGEPRAAVKSYLAALNADPTFAPGYVSLGKVFRKNGQDEKALQAFKRARELDPSYPEVHYELGIFYKQRGRIEPAIAALLSCIRVDSEFKIVHFELAELFILQEAHADALVHLQKHLDKYPQDQNAWVARATACIELDLFDEARIACQRALQIKPSHCGALIQMGRIHVESGDYPGARQRLNAAIIAHPDDPLAHAGLAGIDAAEGQFGRALESISRAGHPRGYDVTTLLLYCRILAALGRTDEAIELLAGRLAERRDPVAARRRCNYMLGHLHELQGEREKAFRCYQNANDLHGQRFDVDAWMQRLQQCINFYTPARLARVSRAKPRRHQPVFLAALPGAGLQLIQGLLQQHPDTQISQCRRSLTDIAADLPSVLASAHSYPDAVSDARSSEFTDLAAEYLQSNFETRQAALYLDQNANNWLELGMGALLFPGMRVIQIVTDPLFAVMDMYTRDLRKPDFGYASDMRGIGRQVRGFSQMMAHWHELNEFRVLQIRLETLLKNPRTMSKRLFAFAGLEWRPEVMEFFTQRVGQLDRLQHFSELNRRYQAFASLANPYLATN